jgi:hypothetical protein
VVLVLGKRVVAWMVAAVVTVGLVAGGMLLARGERTPAVLPALDLDAAGAGTAGGADAGAAAEPAPARAGGAEPAKPSGGGASGNAGAAGAAPGWPPVTYQLDGSLPDLPDRAQAWKVTDDPGRGRVDALAAALGLGGPAKEDPAGWTFAAAGRSLTVNRLAGAPWTYGTGVLAACAARVGGPYRPPVGIQCLDADSPVSNKPGVAPARPRRPADLPSRQEAERVARQLAAKAGLDLAGAGVEVADSWGARLVTVTPAVGGLPTSGFAWTVSVGPKGRIQHASGYLAIPEPADTYPLIGVDQGFERLKRTPALGPILRADIPAIEPAPCPPGGKVPCAAKPLKPRVAKVTGVRLGLQLAPAVAKGSRPADLGYLLPAYLFQLEGGWTDVRSIVAVPDRYLTRP